MKKLAVTMLAAFLLAGAATAGKQQQVMTNSPQLQTIYHSPEADTDPIADAIVTRADVDLTFTNDDTNPWTIGDGNVKNGNCGKSYSTSTLTMNYSSSYKTELIFDWRCYNYSNHSALRLFVDGVQMSSTTNSSYNSIRLYIDPGQHVIVFKDSIGNSTRTENYSYIKNLKLKEISPLEAGVLTDHSKPLTFTNDDVWPWTIEDGYIQNGNYGHSNTTSKISTTFTIDKTSKFALLYRCMRANGNSGNLDYHQFKLRINGIQYEYAYNRTAFDNPWKFALEPGTYTIEFVDSVYNTSTEYVTQIKDIELSSNWVEVDLSSAGTLGVEVLYLVNVLTDVELLKVKGPINSTDWATIKQMTNLLAIDLSEASITSVPNNAFEGLSKLSVVKLPEGPTSIGSYAFIGTQIFNIDIPNSVTKIGDGAFYQTRVRTVNFGSESQLQTIGCDAFYECTSLEEFIMPNTVTSLVQRTDYSDRRSRTFYGCSNLKKLWLSDALPFIPAYLAYKADIRQLHLPISCESIGNDAFNNNPNLQRVVFPETLKTIWDYAFAGCYALDSVALPLHLSSLEYKAFCDNTALTYLELPSSITYNRQFAGCTALKTVVCRSATPPSIYSDPFMDARSKKLITLVVPSFAVVNYKLDSYWYQFGDIREGDDIDYWMITSPLSLTNNRRMKGKPDIDLYYGGQFTVGGNAPMETGIFNLFVNESNPGRLLNTCEAMTADNVSSNFEANAETWYFITPLHDVDLSKVTISNNASFVFRYYDGSSRAANGTGNSWRNVDNGKLIAGQGYIFRCNTYAVVTFPAEVSVHSQVFNTEDVSTTLNVYEAAASANKSWNYVGNPYPCYYDIYYMDFTAPITVWTGSTYKAYSIVDDNLALRPMQAFFVQKPDAVDNIVFHKEGRQLTSDINHAAAARTFRASANENRCFFDLQMIGDEMADETRVVINEEAALSYEIERDASKFMSFETTVPQIFTLDSDDNGYAINERPLSDGTVRLAYYAGLSDFYTITAIRAEGDIYLFDAVTNKTVNLNEQDYTFHSDATNGVNSTRFILSLNVNHSETTGIEVLKDKTNESDEMYDLEGRKVLPSNKKGIYIQNGQKIVR